MAKFYVVWKGRKTGVFTTWEECAAQVSGFTGAEYKAFPNREMAERAFQGNYQDYKGKPASSRQWLFAPHPPVSESYCVDAACSPVRTSGRCGSPGQLEWRGVHTSTNEEIFRQGPYANGTNNVGEFLALVHALAWLAQKGPALSRGPELAVSHRRAADASGTNGVEGMVEGIAAPVYSDSETALAWVKAKKCNTDLAPDAHNAPLFELIARAETWLKENDPINPVLKWDTEAWGEIPADFNRK